MSKNDRYQQLREHFHQAMDLAEVERASYLDTLRHTQPELADELASLLSAIDPSDAVIDAGISAQHSALGGNAPTLKGGVHVGPYRIERLLGRGGMGDVYLAERDDGAFDLRVAIKLIRWAHADASLRERFRRERQTLAQLEHPGIAHVLDGGDTAEGWPYLVMEYVDGTPLDVYCASRSLEERLLLFMDVCAVVQFAHSRLIVHRDLKPANILVTAGGEAKLLDFGIAKLLDEAAPNALTATSDRSYTAAYASPEQILGQPVTTATDVYALGVILYGLLSGREPYAFATNTPMEIARVVCDEQPRKPSERIADSPDPTVRAQPMRWARALRGDLDNIVLMALRKEPDRRYRTVQQFAEDIRAHLKQLPVTARPDTFAYRAGKFVRRNALGVAAALLLAATLLGGIVATRWQERRAEAERVLAEQRFDDVRQLANSLIFDLHDDIAALPGATAARQKLVTIALHYLERLGATAGERPDLLSELAAAYERIGDVQGNPANPNLGDLAGALQSYQHGEDLLRTPSLAVARPREQPLQLFGLIGGKANLLMWAGKPVDAEAEYAIAIPGLEKALAQDPDNTTIRRKLADVRLLHGDLQLANSAPDAAMRSFSDAKRDFEIVLKAHPDDVDLARRPATCEVRIARTLEWNDKVDEAASHLTSAIKSLDALALANPGNSGLAKSQYIADITLGKVLARQKHLPEAITLYERARAIARSASERDPLNRQARRDYAMSSAGLGDRLTESGNIDGALKLFREALGTQSDLLKEDSSNIELLRDIGNSWERIGTAQQNAGQYDAADEAFQQALQQRKAALARVAAPHILRDVANSHELLGDLNELRRSKAVAAQVARYREQACAAYAAALQQWDMIIQRKDNVAADQPTLDGLHRHLAACAK